MPSAPQEFYRRHPLATLAASLLLASGALIVVLLVPGRAAQQQASAPGKSAGAASLAYPGEKHLAHIRQLTFGGESAEAYFSADDKYSELPASGTVLRPAHARSRRAEYSVRPDLHHARARLPARTPPRRSHSQNAEQRPGPHHLQLLLSRRATAFFIHPLSRPTRRARRPPTIRKATSGRSTTPTRSIRPSPTAATFARSPKLLAITPSPPSRATASTSSSPPRAMATSTSSPWTPTAAT